MRKTSHNLFVILILVLGIVTGCVKQENVVPPKETVTDEIKGEEIIGDDIGLGEHQIALNDLYVEIPYRKEQVNLYKRVENETIIIDIRDKDSNKLLFTYGEKLSKSNQKLVYREIKLKKSKIKLIATLELNPISHKITVMNQPTIEILSDTEKIETEFISAVSRSGGYPTEEVEVLANLTLINENYDREDIYEGYLLGVVKTDTSMTIH